jgi:uncharacterized SAM-binding protein YcdF (DUF218 family)
VFTRVRLAPVALVLMLASGWALVHAGTALVVRVPIDSPDAIVSLASKEWERLPVTASLARHHPGAVVLLTEPQEVTIFNCHLCAGRVAELVRDGVEEARIHLVPASLGGTRGEALAIVTFARQMELRRMLVVTSPYHTRRALATFRAAAAGTDIEVGIEPSAAVSAAVPERWWRTPFDRWYVRYEWAAILYYAARWGIVSLTALQV